jgi:hypothetical protein
MDLLQQIVARAKADKQRIVLPEAEEERTLKAADKVLADDLADIILIGNPANIKNLAAQWGLNNIDKATIVDPQNNPKTEEYAEKLAELRKKKGMTVEQARELVTKNNLYLGCMIIKTEGADGQISGALSTTGDTLLKLVTTLYDTVSYSVDFFQILDSADFRVEQALEHEVHTFLVVRHVVHDLLLLAVRQFHLDESVIKTDTLYTTLCQYRLIVHII